MDILFEYVDVRVDKSVFVLNSFPEMHDFEETSMSVFKYLSHVVHLFQWFGLEKVTERASTLQHLGYLLLHELEQMHAMHTARSSLLCDEHCDIYEQWLRLIDDRIRRIDYFSDEAEEVMENIYLDFSKRRLLIGLRDMYERMDIVVRLSNTIEDSWERCNELNLHYDSEHLLLMPMGVRKFVYMMIHFMIQLSIPSRRKTTEKEFAVIFRNTLQSFYRCPKGQSEEEKYGDKLADEIAGQDEERQLEILKTHKKRLALKIREYLEGFGVDYCGIGKDRTVGRLGRQLYERLNDINTDDEKEKEWETVLGVKPKRMKNRDLRCYFVKEVQMQFLNRKIEELNENMAVRKKSSESRGNHQMVKDVVTIAEKKKSWTGIFIVDENKLAVCLAKLYEGYFGENRKYRLEGKCDQSLFFGYLYLLIEKEGLGKENFAESSRKPFFEFLKEKVVKKTEKTMRTFHNRVDELQKLREQLLSSYENLRDNPVWKNNSDYKNFHGILGNFHQTRYFKELERLKKQ